MKRVYGTPGTASDGKGRSSVLLGDDCADRVQWVSNEHEAAGKSFKVTDGYRPRGVPADYYIDDETKTSSGGFNQYYARGQHFRRGAPYAAPPGNSDHELTGDGQGAIDCDVADLAFRLEKMAAVGMDQTDPSETWHFAIRRAPAAWWDRSKVVYPGQGATPAPANTAAPLLQEVPMIRAQQNDAGASAKTFGISIGATHITPAENVGLEEYARELRAKSANGYPVEPLQLSSGAITHVSNVGRRAAFTDEIRAKVDAIARGQILYPGQPYNAFEALVGVMREKSGQPGVEIDEKLLAESLAEALKPTITKILIDLGVEGLDADNAAEVVALRVVESQTEAYEVPDASAEVA